MPDFIDQTSVPGDDESTLLMVSTSISHVEGSARIHVEERSDLLESRLWDRARFNLMLLYGGRRGMSLGASSGTATVGPISFATTETKF